MEYSADQTLTLFFLNCTTWDFPDIPGAKTPCSHCMGPRFNPVRELRSDVLHSAAEKKTENTSQHSLRQPSLTTVTLNSILTEFLSVHAQSCPTLCDPSD